MTQGVHRVTSNSRRGRQLISRGALANDYGQLTKAQREWNEAQALEREKRKAGRRKCK